MSIYAEPQHVDDLEQCFFYHTMELPGIGLVEGNWDLRAQYEAYTGGVELRGARFLDVGAATGYLGFEAERRGAEVVSFDSEGPHQHHHVPFREVRVKPTDYSDSSLYQDDFQALRNSYWLSHRLLGSRAQCFYGNVYELPPELGEFDVVMVGQILGHLRDPLTALTSIAARCRGRLIITDGMIESDQPVAFFQPNVRLPATPSRQVSWWHMSPVLFRNFLQIVGLEVIAFASNQYTFRSRQGARFATTLKTLVAVRTEPLE
jgi:SAM-dependent methyltransferase